MIEDIREGLGDDEVHQLQIHVKRDVKRTYYKNLLPIQDQLWIDMFSAPHHLASTLMGMKLVA